MKVVRIVRSARTFNNMKKTIATMIMAVFAIAPAFAEDVTYVAGMTGVT